MKCHLDIHYMDPTLNTDRKSHSSLNVTLKRAHIQAVHDILLITVVQMKEKDLLKVVEQNS